MGIQTKINVFSILQSSKRPSINPRAEVRALRGGGRGGHGMPIFSVLVDFPRNKQLLGTVNHANHQRVVIIQKPVIELS